MIEKRFIFKQDGNFHTVIDTVENKSMGVFEFKENEFPTYTCFYMIIDKMNELYEENQDLVTKKEDREYELLHPKEKYEKLLKKNEQLQEKLKKYEEIEELKKEDFMNCYNCKHDRSVHDGIALDGMCAIKELMNLDGHFDTEYHKLPAGTFCPCWELKE